MTRTQSYRVSLSIFSIFLFLSLIGMQQALAKEDTPESIPGTQKVSAMEVIDLVDTEPDLVIIDSRKPADREAAGWIPGAVALPNFETTPETLAKILASKDSPVLFYCNGPKCGRSGDAAQKAIDAGYTNIYWFRGGWEDWSNAGLPVER